MNHVEIAMRNLLAPLVTGQFHPLALPDTATYPCMRYAMAGSDPQNTICGASNLDNGHYRIDIFAKTYNEVLALSGQVRDSMDGFVYKSLCVGEFDFPYETDQRLYRRTLDFSVWANRPTV